MTERLGDDVLKHIRASYGSFFDARLKQELDPANVPVVLRPFVPNAQLWGVIDDWEREERVLLAPRAAKEDILLTVRSIDDELDKWLAGDEVTSPAPSREYLAFSAMRVAADFV